MSPRGCERAVELHDGRVVSRQALHDRARPSRARRARSRAAPRRSIAHPHSCGRGRAAWCDGAVRRPFVADDDRRRRPQRAARLAGAGRRRDGRGARRSPPRSRGSRACSQPQPVATGPFAGIVHTSRRTGRSAPVRARCWPFRPATTAPPDVSLPPRLAPAGEIVLDQQLAATLQVQPGDTVLLTPRPGARPVRLPGRAASPSSPRPTSSSSRSTRCSGRRRRSRRRTSRSCRSRPSPGRSRLHCRAIGTSGACGRRGSRDADRRAVAGAGAGRPARARRGALRSALLRADQIRNASSARCPGRCVFVDNLSDALNSAAGDALYAETLYIMLAVPGALVALGARLSRCARHGRARPARPRAPARARRIATRPACCSRRSRALRIGLVAGRARHRRRARSRFTSSARAAGSGLTRVAATSRSASRSRSPAHSSRGLQRRCVLRGTSARAGAASFGRRPLWQRLYLDVVCLAVERAHLLAHRPHRLLGGRQPRLEPDALALGLHVLRAGAALDRRGAAARASARSGARLAGRARGGRQQIAGAGSCSSAPAAAAQRSTAAVLVVGLLLAFGVNLGVFAATYDQQARVDAQLTLGADVVVTAPPGDDSAARARAANRDSSRVSPPRRRRPQLRVRRT